MTEQNLDSERKWEEIEKWQEETHLKKKDSYNPLERKDKYRIVRKWSEKGN